MKELIERIEGAEGESLPLFFEACQAAFPSLRSRDHSIEECEQSDLRIYRFRRMIDAEAWLSAAEMLVPEGWQCGFEMHGCYDQVDRPEAWCWPYSSDFEPDWRDGNEGYRSNPHGYRAVAATPALALVAAALRARNGSNGDG